MFKICCCIPNFTSIGWLFTEILQFNNIQNGGRPPPWICCDVMILHQGTDFYDANIDENFHIDWCCGLWDTLNVTFLRLVLRQPDHMHLGLWNVSITPNLIKLFAPNLVATCITVMWRWHMTKSRNRKLIRLTSLNEYHFQRSAVGPSPSLAQLSGTHCQTSSATHRYRLTVSVASLKHFCCISPICTRSPQ